MTITKASLIDSIYKQSDLRKQESTSAVESLLGIIKHTLDARRVVTFKCSEMLKENMNGKR